MNIFNRGHNLKGGLIDGQSVINGVFLHKDQQINSELMNRDAQAPLDQLRQHNQWQQAIKLLEKNPKMLLDAMPSPRSSKGPRSFSSNRLVLKSNNI